MSTYSRRGSTRKPTIALCGLLLIAMSSGCSDLTTDVNSAENAGLSAFQQTILNDGVVSAAEYESAVIAQRDCLIGAGYEPDPIEWKGSQLGFGVNVDYTNAADPEAEDARFLEEYQACQDEYVSRVMVAWGETLPLSDPEERERLVASFVECLQGAGLNVSADTALEDVVEKGESELSYESYQACYEANDRLFYVNPN